MKIYILFRDVPFEFGEIHGVFLTKEKAEIYKNELREETIKHYISSGIFNYTDLIKGFNEQYDIQEWEAE